MLPSIEDLQLQTRDFFEMDCEVHWSSLRKLTLSDFADWVVASLEERAPSLQQLSLSKRSELY